MEPSLGNLEEMILLVLMAMRQDAYGVSIQAAYQEELDQSISLSAVHTVLRRLEQKGYIRSELGGATPERGGRRKRLYAVTAQGYRAAETLKARRARLWQFIPRLDT